MIVHALRAAGADPAFFLGGELPGRRRRRRRRRTPAGATGEWVVAEADESDGSFLELRPEVAVVTNVELDHHSRWSSRAELLGAFAAFAAPRPAAWRCSPATGPRSSRRRGASAVAALRRRAPGPRGARAARSRVATTSLNARAALAALELAGLRRSTRPAAGARLASRGCCAACERKGSRDGRRDLRRLRPPPDRGRGGARGAARARPAAPDRRLPAPPLLAHQGARRSGSAPRSPPPTRSACSTSTRPARSRSASSPGSAGSTSPRAAADRAGGPAGAGGCADADRAERGARRRGSARATCWSRSAPATSSSSARRWSTDGAGVRMSASPTGVERDYPLARLTTVRTGGAADSSPARRPRTSWSSCSPGRRARAAGGRSGRLGLEPAGRRRRIPRPGAQARRRARARSSATATRDRLRRRRPPALGGGEGRRLGALRARVRDQHPRHRRRRGADERQRLRRRAGAGARVGRRLHRRRASSAAAPEPARLLLPALQPRRPARSSPGPRSRSPRPTRRRSRRRSPRCAASAARRSRPGSRPSARPSRTPTTRAPRAAPPGSCSRRPAAAGLRGRRRPLLRQARQLRRERRRGDDRRRARADGRGPPPRPRALRRRARARGPGARRGRVARRLGAGRRASRVAGRPAPGRSRPG